MWRNLIILIALALLTPPTPPLTAVWERPGIARVSWHGAGCLWKEDTLYKCYDTSGVLRLGATGPLDGRHRPAANDVFRLVRAGGAVEVARLRSVLYFPAFR